RGELDDLGGAELVEQVGAQRIVDTRVGNQRVGEADRELPPARQCALGVVVLDERDRLLVETLLACGGEPQVLADPAARDARVAEAADLLGRIVDDPLGPERAVVVVECLPQRGLVIERREAALRTLDARRHQTSNATEKRARASKIATASVSVASCASS